MDSHVILTRTFNRGLLRLSVWALLMFATLLITAQFSLAKTIWVPMVFLPMMVPMVFLPLEETKNTHGRTRFWRFALWASLMFLTCVITREFAPRKTVLVPVVFLPLMVPIVLLPMKMTTKTSKQA